MTSMNVHEPPAWGPTHETPPASTYVMFKRLMFVCMLPP